MTSHQLALPSTSSHLLSRKSISTITDKIGRAKVSFAIVVLYKRSSAA